MIWSIEYFPSVAPFRSPKFMSISDLGFNLSHLPYLKSSIDTVSDLAHRNHFLYSWVLICIARTVFVKVRKQSPVILCQCLGKSDRTEAEVYLKSCQ